MSSPHSPAWCRKIQKKEKREVYAQPKPLNNLGGNPIPSMLNLIKQLVSNTVTAGDEPSFI